MSKAPDNSGIEPGRGKGLEPCSIVGLFISTSILAACMALLFLAMRGVMAPGGVVAGGGPLAIEHSALDWILLFLITIAVWWISALAHAKFQLDAGGPPLALLSWRMLFLLIGFNFFNFGVNHPGNGERIAWGWLALGVAYLVMALLPAGVVGSLKIGPALMISLAKPWAPSARNYSLILLDAAAAALGVWGGIYLFKVFSG